LLGQGGYFFLPANVRHMLITPMMTRQNWNSSPYVTIALPPFRISGGGQKVYDPPGICQRKIAGGLTTYRFSAVPALFYQIRRGSATGRQHLTFCRNVVK
jgi:hypothetical protein